MDWLHLDIMANIASSNETLAYAFHSSDNPRHQEFADRLMKQSNEVKRFFRDNLEGKKRDLYLLKAEGKYIPPKKQKEGEVIG